MPIASIVIPTYNRSNLVERAIKSVLEQSFRDFELIVVDDASTDDTEQRVGQINDTRIKIIRHEKNKGAPAARNTGIKASQGEYIGFLDDDDEWLPKKLEKQLEAFQSSVDDVGLIYTGFYFVSQKTGIVLSKIAPTRRGTVYPDLLRRNIMAGSSPLIRYECFSKTGLFDETLPSCQDWDMWIRISKHYKFDFAPEPMMKVYVHGRQISVDLNAKIIARQILIRKYRQELLKNPMIFAFLLKRLGVLQCLADNRRKAFGYFARSLRLVPVQRDCLTHVLFSLLVPKMHKRILLADYITELDGINFYY